jgi:Phosphodiester glycosidase
VTATISAKKFRIFGASAIALLVGLTALASGPEGGRARAAGRYDKRVKKIVDGLVYIKMYDNKLNARIKILKIDPTSPVTLDVALSNDSLPGRETTSSMVARHNAIAGINASFGTSWGRPIGTFAEDGSLKASPFFPGGVLAFARGQGALGAHIGHHDLTIKGRGIENGSRFRIPDWNDNNEDRERIAAYTHSGGGYADPGSNSCSMRLKPKGPLRWSGDYKDLRRKYVVKTQICRDDPLGLGKGPNVVLTSKRGSPGSNVIQNHNGGQHVRIAWSVHWPKAMDAVGGSPVLINDGVKIDTCEGYVCERHPRTGVGRLADGKVLLVTVDGRSTSSRGMTGKQFAGFFKHMGAVDAINMDGGGSTTMVLRGEVVNVPSDSGGQRAVASAIIVHNGQDADEPTPKEGVALPTSTPTLSSYAYVTTPNAGELALEDPASTGGLLDALAKGGFGDPPVDLKGDLRDELKVFRRFTP